ncbi:AAA family ATPase [Ornithinibacillus sp. L9]|uniref:DNA 3'-5' helicase n=1 Tax=Ornithinibacillus caprae TaxID=2678566 RepID=A0A6N8FI26_9BACI|nr:RNA polymerase recycling motor HelD [Ornithinibacillus caprae]MUK89250.1 AAA family ATPase [Ornithinibacillus caprae]
MSNKANNRAAEQQRVDNVIHEINQKAQQLHAKAKGIKDDVIDLRKTFWDDVKVNLDEPDDIIETEASLKQQAELLSQRERSHGKIDEQLKILKRLKESPYFGRIDFVESGEKEAEPIYIGIASLMDRDEEDFLVYDWRAPISSLYYDYSPGKAAYEIIDGKITGEITLKRQFIIRHGLIKGMFDTGVTIGDELLQQALGNNASSTMKNIVATIQKEQNRIIRNERSNLLIVQGVAGSGKTSAALQRIAYLMYRYREELHAENVVMFSPNPLFSSYIANVLPELGETNVRQTTFLDYLRERTIDSVTIESPFEQMEYVLTKKDDEDYRIRLLGMDYKSSQEYMELIDEYISSLENGGIRFKNITFQKRILISKEEIANYFYSLDKEIAIPNKIELVTKWLLEKIREHQKTEIDQDWVMEQVELLDKEEYLKAYYKDNEFENDVSMEEEILRKEIVRRFFSRIKKQIRNLEYVNVLATFYRFFLEWESKGNTPPSWTAIAKQTASYLKKRFLTWEDATPYVYFQERILGDNLDRSVRHLFIDEAQDYSAFQYAFIKRVFPYTRMTLLGDINQAIYTQVTKENPLIPEEVEGNHERITLNKSYRSTKQIVEFTSYFAPGEEVIEPFEREGELPKIVQSLNGKDIVETLVNQVTELQEKGNETIAIICKTMSETNKLYEQLKDMLPISIIHEETYTFQKGLLILPVYLAKGIEFDAVIIPDASAQGYVESDRTLFYTACTRAMHELAMVVTGSACQFIDEVPKDKYEVISR